MTEKPAPDKVNHSDILQRITALETTLNGHIEREEKTTAEVKWLTRFIFVTMVGIIVKLSGIM